MHYLSDRILTERSKNYTFYKLTRAVKRLIASKIKVCVYIVYVCVACIIILYI